MRCCAVGGQRPSPAAVAHLADGSRRTQLRPCSKPASAAPSASASVNDSSPSPSSTRPIQSAVPPPRAAPARRPAVPAPPVAGTRRARSPRRRSRRTPPGRCRARRRPRRRPRDAAAQPASTAAATSLRRARWRASVAIPSETSIIAVAPSRCSARAAANRGSGAAKRRCSPRRRPASGRRPRRCRAVQQRQARAGAAERAGDSDQVPWSGAVAADQRAGSSVQPTTVTVTVSVPSSIRRRPRSLRRGGDRRRGRRG